MPPWRRILPATRWRVLVFLVSCLAVGAAVGILWAVFASRPGYVVADDLGASLNERGIAEIFAADALFSVLLAAVGVGVGVAGWLVFHRWGWWVCLITVITAGLAGLVAWQVGLLVTPSNFAERLASAVSGDVVAVDLQLHAKAALLVAPFTAITPVMLLAAFWPESKDMAAIADTGMDEPEQA
ncbi:hypothetical protein EAX62_11640 [Tessaracoccus antarcticus]|uniref:DUF2567 domain-containing protein n=2 Tax=Tessaracoccus antarcticus TaxID=2479848 RepID=A0A3M0GNB2_9ACTN|nr:hypothetical protein EAX62_11640 [Tessaracoccus antarcticus]